MKSKCEEPKRDSSELCWIKLVLCALLSQAHVPNF